MTKICSRSRATEIILPCDMLAAMLQYVRCSDNNHNIRERTAYMERKQIDFVTHPQETHMVGDGFRVHNFIPQMPGMSRYDMDPFLLLDYNAAMSVTPGVPRGVGTHPHRGFSTVTFAYRGSVEHRDSRGNHGIISEGDVQWMTAAKGVLHEELYEREFAARGGCFQMVQLWVNLPANHKMDEPSYQSIRREDMGRVELPSGGGVVEVVSGQYKGVSGPARSHVDVTMLNLRMNKGGKAEFSFNEKHTTFLIVLSGAVEVNCVGVPQDNVLKFKRKGESFDIVATADNTVVLLVSGAPLHEPIVGIGPFVMNSHEELVQAFEDFSDGKFGYM